MSNSPITFKLSKDGENDKLKYGSSSMQGWRDTMEDAHVAVLDVDNKTSFFGVYDGHGGRVVARYCAKYLHQQVISNEAYKAGDVETSLRSAFFRMDDMIQDLNSDFVGPTSAGSTACVALIKDKKLFVANAGDSRCVISRNGRAHDLSKDHKPEHGAEAERIREAGGFIHGERVNGCLSVSRAIGDTEYKQNKSLPSEKQMVTADPDITTTELCDDDDFLVVACDGIWDCMSSYRLVDFIHEQLRSETKLSRVCEKVVDRCVAPKNRGERYDYDDDFDYDDDESVYKCVPGFDNMTIILVLFKKPNSSEN